MGLFDKKPKFLKGVAPPKIRVEKVPVPQRPKLTPKAPSRASSHSASPRPSPQPAETARDRKRKTSARPQKRISPVASSRVDFGSDSGEDDEDWVRALDARKPKKRGKLDDGRYVDPNRRLKHPKALEEVVGGVQVIHAAEVASVELKCEPVLGAKVDEVAVELRYPSLQDPER